MTSITLLAPIKELLAEMSVDGELHAHVRKCRLELELKTFRHHIPRRTDMFHASALALGGENPVACRRKLAYAIQGIKVEGKGHYRDGNIFEAGHDAHAKYQGLLRWIYGELFIPEVPTMDEELRITGTCDGVLDGFIHKDKTIRIGVEIKTTKERSFATIMQQPAEAHIDQATIYAFLLKLDAVSIIYECKNDQRILEHIVIPDKTRWGRITERAAKIYRTAKAGHLPPREASVLCQWCGYRVLCMPDRPERVVPAYFRGDSRCST